MKRIIVFGLAVLAAVGGCSLEGIKGDGVVVTTNYPLAEFSSLQADGAYRIKWSQGKPGISISADQNLLPLITTAVDRDSLTVRQEKNLRPSKGITINVSSASLAKVELNGAVSLTASNVAGAQLKLEANGASSIHVMGSVTNLEGAFAGACDLDAQGLQAQTATLSLSGACKADVTVSERLTASISGAGEIRYGGNPKTVEKDVSGVGKIRAR